jgi:hypothetical protein
MLAGSIGGSSAQRTWAAKAIEPNINTKAANFMARTVNENVSKCFEKFFPFLWKNANCQAAIQRKSVWPRQLGPSISFVYEEMFPPRFNRIMAAFRPNSGDALFGIHPNFHRTTSSGLSHPVQAGPGA